MVVTGKCQYCGNEKPEETFDLNGRTTWQCSGCGQYFIRCKDELLHSEWWEPIWPLSQIKPGITEEQVHGRN
jgi:hypothetical protein